MSNLSSVILLYELASNSLILTQRSMSLRNHPGEICFPGGRWEKDDVSLWSTALRELYEELGIPAERVHLIKELIIEKSLAGSTIQPWFATIAEISPYVINHDEVSRLITIPMDAVRLISNYREINLTIHGLSVHSCQFIASKYFVWGVTARIMKQLCVESVFDPI